MTKFHQLLRILLHILKKTGKRMSDFYTKVCTLLVQTELKMLMIYFSRQTIKDRFYPFT
jgi:hypothetical protein